jgi:peptide chain release factor 2
VRDYSDDLKELRRRWAKLTAISDRFQPGQASSQRSRPPDLWDDQDEAKRINTEYANVKTDIDQFDILSGELEDAEVLHELAREVDDASQEPELDAAVASITNSSTCSTSSLFTGEHDETVASFRSMPKTASTQDWAEILLRMYGRWAERAAVQLDGISRAPGRHHVSRVPLKDDTHTD